MSSTKKDPVLDGVKGMLIVFIVLEHNTLMTAQYDWIRSVSDAFAAGCFLILTFAWPLKPMPLTRFLDRYLKYWVPFLALVLVTAVANFLLFSGKSPATALAEFFAAIALASPAAIKESTGFMYLWFLPCLSVLYLIRYLHMKAGPWFLLLAFASFLLVGEVNEERLMETPFSLHVVAFIYLVGVAYARLHPVFMGAGRIWHVLAGIAFLVLVFMAPRVGWELFLAGGIIPSWRAPELMAFYASILLLAIPGIYALIEALPTRVIAGLAFFGEHSMKVYLFHPIVYMGITRIVPVVTHPELSLLATIVISLVLAVVVSKIKLIERLVFPDRLSSLRPGLSR